MAEEFPSSDLSLRTALDENFLIIDITNPSHHEVIGEMDRFTVPMLLHDRAIYMHNAVQYQVEKLDFEQKRAYIKHVDVDYYTTRGFGLDEVLPWDIIDCGVTKAYLLRERERAYAEKTTPSCKEHCNGCGANQLGGKNRWCK